MDISVTTPFVLCQRNEMFESKKKTIKSNVTLTIENVRLHNSQTHDSIFFFSYTRRVVVVAFYFSLYI